MFGPFVLKLPIHAHFGGSYWEYDGLLLELMGQKI